MIQDLVGHNVNFDVNFLYDNCIDFLCKPFPNDFLDTLRLSRLAFRELPNHKLDTLVSEFGIGNPESHRSVADAMKAAECYEYMKRHLQKNGIEIKNLYASGRKAQDIVTDKTDFDETNPLYGKKCVFTGKLEKMNRAQAMQCVADLGGKCQDGVTKETDFLILGNFDYTANVKGNKSSKVKKAEEKKPLSTRQQQELVLACRGEKLELFTLLCLYAGLRRGEALGLCWEHVHLGRTSYIDVRASVSYAEVGKKQYSPNLKSEAARRTIPVPHVLEQALRGQRQESGFVLRGEKTGKWLPESSYQRYWKDITKKVPFHVHPHLLRHTYITELCASGMDIKKIQYLAGHADPRVTLKIYAHVKENKPEELISAIRGAFKRPMLGVKLGVKGRFRIKNGTVHVAR